jgi:tetratricopeptide (TPR) repeat protein
MVNNFSMFLRNKSIFFLICVILFLISNPLTIRSKEKITIQETSPDSLLKKARSYFLKEDYKTSLLYIEKGIIEARKQGKIGEEADLILIEAYIYLNKGLAQKAMEKFSEAEIIGHSLNNDFVISGAVHGKGRAYIELKLYSEAIDILKLGLKKYVDSKDSNRIGVFYNSLGMAYSQLGIPEKSIYYYEQFLKIANKLNDSTSIVYAMVNLGEVFNETKNYSKSIEYMSKARVLNELVGDAQASAAIAGNLARHYHLLKMEDSSLFFLRQAIHICDIYDNARFQPDNYKLLIKLYKTMNMTDSALWAAETFLKYNDSLTSEDKVNTMHYMNSYFEMEDKLHESALVEQQLKTRTIMLTFSVVLMILFILLLVLLYSRFKLKMKLHKQEKNKLNLTIDEKNRELVGKVLNQSQSSDISQAILGNIDKALGEDNAQKTKKILTEIKNSLSQKKPGTFNWENFKIHFEQVHPQFFDNLKEVNKSLTTNDLRHCAYIRMNMNTKEIAGLMNISDRSVQTARYRIKKKLQLSMEIDLTDYIHDI